MLDGTERGRSGARSAQSDGEARGHEEARAVSQKLTETNKPTLNQNSRVDRTKHAAFLGRSRSDLLAPKFFTEVQQEHTSVWIRELLYSLHHQSTRLLSGSLALWLRRLTPFSVAYDAAVVDSFFSISPLR